MQNTVIRVNKVSKKYQLYDKPINRLKEALHPLKKKYHKDFYALKNLTFQINKGETIGFIGKNGSGKSTILKILTGILTPTTGTVEVHGKVSALLELGAGFNMEYTGIENIYLNGTMMGLEKKEIDKRLEDILTFADIGDFINQPVKTYSSGMFVRLAFSVAVHVDPEILIIDEALAVGDAAFTLKCMNRMREFVNQQRTIIFVTHDVQIVRSFCSRAIWLNQGQIQLDGQVNHVTSEYVKFLFNKNDEEQEVQQEQIEPSDIAESDFSNAIRWGSGHIKIIAVKLLNHNETETEVLEWGEQISVIIKARAEKDVHNSRIGFGFAFRNKNALDIVTSTTIEEGNAISSISKNKEVYIKFRLQNILSPGDYSLVVNIEERMDKVPTYYDFIENAITFKVIGKGNFFSMVKQNVQQEIIMQ